MLSDRQRYETLIDVLEIIAREARPTYVSECTHLYHQLERLRRDCREAFPDTGGGETPGEG